MGRNFALNETQGEVGVSLEKKNIYFFFGGGGGETPTSADLLKMSLPKKKKKNFLGILIFILSPHKHKLW